MAQRSTRARIVERRTYLRPLDEDKNIFETPEQAVDRIISHQRWLWERAKGESLDAREEAELIELRALLIDGKVTVSGRTRWLGGTDIAKRRESSQFNCSFAETRTIYDLVDAFWLLLQGCGFGCRKITGSLNGFSKKIPELEIIRSKKVIGDPKGRENNIETFDTKTKLWTISVGDSAEAWAKSLGKLVAGKYNAKKMIIDFSEIRAAGERLKGYGWISSGDEALARAYAAIFKLLNENAGKLLDVIAILDIINWLGTVLSSRRAAEIALMVYGELGWKEFATAKKDHFLPEVNQPQRSQSNNSLMFFTKPSEAEIKNIFKIMEDSGGSEPGFINAEAATKRAPWFKGVNPCAEILLGDKSFCNLVEIALFRFNGDPGGLQRACFLIARANYRQTCVNLDDGILQRGWHELNEFLRLCGVGVTGVVSWEHQHSAAAWRDLRMMAQSGCHSMADDLGLPRAKAVTTIKPSGTASKTLSLEGQECPEGIHSPLGRFIFNNINFSKHDPLVAKLKTANYYVFDNPYDTTGCLVRFPVEYKGVEFSKVVTQITTQGDNPIVLKNITMEVNLESAVSQLERYKLVMENYVDHNCSITISYDKKEVPAIIEWIMENWDTYVGVSFIYRNDPMKTAADLGYPYLPQECVTEEIFRDYADNLFAIDLNDDESTREINMGEECATGACPVR